MTDDKSLARTAEHSAIMAQFQPVLATIPEAGDDVTSRMAEVMLNSETEIDPDDFFGGAWGSKDHIGEDFIFHSLRWRMTDYDEGLPFYLLADVTDITSGESGTMTIGGATAVTQLLSAHKNGRLPRAYRIVEGNKTKAGYKPIQLRPISMPEAGPEA